MPTTSSGPLKVVGLGVGLGVVTAGTPIPVAWSNNDGAQTDDWLGLFRGGASNSDYIGPQRYTGTVLDHGSTNVLIPPVLAPNAYELRFFRARTTTLLATSPAFYVVESPDHVGLGSLTNVQATYIGSEFRGWAPGGRLVFSYGNSLWATNPAYVRLFVRNDPNFPLASSAALTENLGAGTIDLPSNLNVLQNYELRLEVDITIDAPNVLAWSTPFFLGTAANLPLASVTLRRVWDYLRNYDTPPSRQDVYFTTENPHVQDVVLLRHHGTDWAGVIATYPTNGQRSGMAPFYIDTGYAPGDYEAAFVDGSVNQIAYITNPFTVTGA